MMQLFFDVSEISQYDHKTGIQRVVRSLLNQLLNYPPNGYTVEPVFAKKKQEGYYYARNFKENFLKLNDLIINITIDDVPIAPQRDDIFLRLELQPEVVLLHSDYYADLRSLGVKVYLGVHDLLPVWMPQHFPEGTEENHTKWLDRLARVDGLVCVSRTVADEVACWLDIQNPKRLRPLKLGWFHLGADLAASAPTRGLPSDAPQKLATLTVRTSFLTVGTIEPRKGHAQTLAAFEWLWRLGVDVNWVVIGRHGWHMEAFLERLCNHPELNRRLHWLDGVSDEYLDKVYATVDCLIAPSEGEGFGLPLIEAAQHSCPIIARNIAVFREVAGEHAHYFSGSSPEALATSVQEWLTLNTSGKTPQSVGMHWQTWQQSTEQLLDIVLGGQWYKDWVQVQDGVLRFQGSDIRLLSQFGKRSGRHIFSTGIAGHLIYGPYIHLDAGTYALRLTGTFEGLPGPNANIEVAMKSGNMVLARSDLYDSDLIENAVRCLVFEVTENCEDLEIRVWVEACNVVKLSLVEVYPFTGNNAPLPV